MLPTHHKMDYDGMKENEKAYPHPIKLMNFYYVFYIFAGVYNNGIDMEMLYLWCSVSTYILCIWILCAIILMKNVENLFIANFLQFI